MTKIDALLEIMAQLRDPNTGCPWDIEQDFSTIAPYTIEEAYEVADAIEREDYDGLKDELGDLLFQVVFHAQMANEAGHFDFSDVVGAICAKMTRRHPHVFSGAPVRNAEEQTAAWEAQKREERVEQSDGSALAGITAGIPEWQRSNKLQKAAARVGFDWPEAAPVCDKVLEELQEVQAATDPGDIEEELGDLLFACVNLARHKQVDVGVALRRANRKFETRFRAMEALGGDDFPSMDLDAKEALWQVVKQKS